jgi:hypothetical protein
MRPRRVSGAGGVIFSIGALRAFDQLRLANPKRRRDGSGPPGVGFTAFSDTLFVRIWGMLQ